MTTSSSCASSPSSRIGCSWIWPWWQKQRCVAGRPHRTSWHCTGRVTDLLRRSFPSAREVSSTQVQDWAFLGWRALLDADKYLQRGSLWEAHHRLHEARERIWMLWATGHGATYPWHGLSQVLDHDPDLLPPGIEATVAGLDSDDLRRAVVAAAGALDHASRVAARKCGTHLHTGIAEYTRRTVTPG